MNKTQSNTRYMDVLTVRPSTGASRGNTGNGRTTPHSSLLVEPIVLPDMQHVSVDLKEDITESCLFYPTGQKNKNMRRELEVAVRGMYEPDHINHHSPGGKHSQNLVADAIKESKIGGDTHRTKHQKKKKTTKQSLTRPAIPLVYKPPVRNYSEVKSLLNQIREKEIQITSTTTLRV